MSAKALAGQVALVTGAGRRLGQAIAVALARAGARVAVGYHTSEAGARDTVRQIEECGGQAVAIKADVSRPDEIKRLVAAAEERLGAPDILVNNAGIFERLPWEQVTEADWDRFLDTNLKSQFFCAQAVAPAMKHRGRGVIVNIASLGGVAVWPSFIPYGVSKAGVIHLTRLLARALAPEIRVNAVAPGTIQFPGEEPHLDYIRRAPLQKTGTPADIARAVTFLCTQADFITGQVLVIDGGYSLT